MNWSTLAACMRVVRAVLIGTTNMLLTMRPCHRHGRSLLDVGMLMSLPFLVMCTRIFILYNPNCGMSPFSTAPSSPVQRLSLPAAMAAAAASRRPTPPPPPVSSRARTRRRRMRRTPREAIWTTLRVAPRPVSSVCATRSGCPASASSHRQKVEVPP